MSQHPWQCDMDINLVSVITWFSHLIDAYSLFIGHETKNHEDNKPSKDTRTTIDTSKQYWISEKIYVNFCKYVVETIMYFKCNKVWWCLIPVRIVRPFVVTAKCCQTSQCNGIWEENLCTSIHPYLISNYNTHTVIVQTIFLSNSGWYNIWNEEHYWECNIGLEDYSQFEALHESIIE